MSSIVEIGVPKILTLYFLKIPSLSNLIPRFKAVYPPNPKSKPSGLSFSIISARDSTVNGTKYTLSAISSALV